MPTYRIRIFAEYESGLPLWMTAIDANAPALSELPVSHPLHRDLEAWNARWNELASDPRGDDTVDHDWSDWPEAVAWNAEGYVLARRLRAEIGQTFEIVYFDYVTERDVRIE